MTGLSEQLVWQTLADLVTKSGSTMSQMADTARTLAQLESGTMKDTVLGQWLGPAARGAEIVQKGLERRVKKQLRKLGRKGAKGMPEIGAKGFNNQQMGAKGMPDPSKDDL